jgi:hypothetical protein
VCHRGRRRCSATALGPAGCRIEDDLCRGKPLLPKDQTGVRFTGPIKEEPAGRRLTAHCALCACAAARPALPHLVLFTCTFKKYCRCWFWLGITSASGKQTPNDGFSEGGRRCYMKLCARCQNNWTWKSWNKWLQIPQYIFPVKVSSPRLERVSQGKCIPRYRFKWFKILHQLI